jgi:hypothetical protein
MPRQRYGRDLRDVARRERAADGLAAIAGAGLLLVSLSLLVVSAISAG